MREEIEVKELLIFLKNFPLSFAIKSNEMQKKLKEMMLIKRSKKNSHSFSLSSLAFFSQSNN